MMNGKLTFAAVLWLASASTVLATPSSLGIAGAYNIFTLGNMIQNGGDSEGKVAVGGNLTASSTSFNQNGVTPGPGVVVNGNASLKNGSLQGGIVWGGSYSNNGSFTANGGSSKGQPIDFLSARIEYEARSAYYASSATSAFAGTVTYFGWGGVTLVGTRSDINVFNIDGSKLSNANTLSISAPASSTVILNISGTTNSLKGGTSLSGIDKTKILFNFFEATSINISGYSLQGSLLAPKAALTGANGNIEGNVIVSSANATGGFEYHWKPFAGALPIMTPASVATPEPESLAMMGLGVAAIAVARRGRRR